MPKKVALLFTLLTLIACILSYKLGSPPVALAKARPALQDAATPALPAPPAYWVAHSITATGAAQAVKPAQAGVQHVVTCISATVTNPTSGGSPIVLQLFDPIQGVVMEWYVPIVPGTSGLGQVSLCGLYVVGSVGQAIYLQFQSSGGDQTVNMIGYDAT